MDRSSGFGSTTCYLFRAFRTRSRFGSVTSSLNLAAHRNSPARSTKSTTSHSCGALSACKHTVSGSFSLPSRGSFHRSLTVLYSIGHMVVFSLWRWSSFLPSGFLVSRRTPDSPRLNSISRTGLLPSFVHLSRCVPLSSLRLPGVLTPRVLLPAVWAAPISLATTFGIVFTFFSSG